MSKLVIVSVYDSAAEVYSKPFFDVSIGAALRAFMDAVSNKESQLNAHPEHFSLWILGNFDQSNAEIDLLPVPERIAKAHDMVKTS